MYTEAIIFKLGHKEGLTLDGEVIKEWPYEEPQPSQEELEIWKSEYQVALGYVAKRRVELPPLEELVVALWEKVVENRPELAEEVQLKRQIIKEKYPKPE